MCPAIVDYRERWGTSKENWWAFITSKALGIRLIKLSSTSISYQIIRFSLIYTQKKHEHSLKFHVFVFCVWSESHLFDESH